VQTVDIYYLLKYIKEIETNANHLYLKASHIKEGDLVSSDLVSKVAKIKEEVLEMVRLLN
jgi:hypothetical protein